MFPRNISRAFSRPLKVLHLHRGYALQQPQVANTTQKLIEYFEKRHRKKVKEDAPEKPLPPGVDPRNREKLKQHRDLMRQYEEQRRDRELAAIGGGKKRGEKNARYKREWQDFNNNFDYWQARIRQDLVNGLPEPQDPCFSERAKKKAWDLHHADPEFWTVRRLANTFQVDIPLMASEIKAWEIRSQAEAAGEVINDGAERAMAERFGELDYPGIFPRIPDRQHVYSGSGSGFDNYYFLDDSVDSNELLDWLRKAHKAKFREAPKYPRKRIPKPVSCPRALPSRGMEKIFEGKHKTKFRVWDISPSKDLYNRKIFIKETDGSWRTGNWEERQFSHNYRTYIQDRFRFKETFPFPDEDQPDTYHPDDRPSFWPINFNKPPEQPDVTSDNLTEKDIDKLFDYRDQTTNVV